jgi:hypothetical protein
MLNISTKKKLVKLQFQLPHDLKSRSDLVLKYHKDNGISIPMDTFVEYLLGRMLEESPDLADFRAYEAEEALKPKETAKETAKALDDEPEAAKEAVAAKVSEGKEPVAEKASPSRAPVSTEAAREIAKREMERRANSQVQGNQSNVTTSAE